MNSLSLNEVYNQNTMQAYDTRASLAQSHFGTLPNELIFNIFKNIDQINLKNIDFTCTAFRYLLKIMTSDLVEKVNQFALENGLCSLLAFEIPRTFETQLLVNQAFIAAMTKAIEKYDLSQTQFPLFRVAHWNKHRGHHIVKRQLVENAATPYFRIRSKNFQLFCKILDDHFKNPKPYITNYRIESMCIFIAEKSTLLNLTAALFKNLVLNNINCEKILNLLEISSNSDIISIMVTGEVT